MARKTRVTQATPVVAQTKQGAKRECNPDHMKTLCAAIKAEGKAALSVGQAIDLIFEDGVRAEHLIKSNDLFSQSVFSAIEAAIIAAKFTKSTDRTLVLMSAEDAKAIGQSAQRTTLTKTVSAYMGNLRGALDRRAIEAGEKAAPEKKAKAVKADAVADAPESGDAPEAVEKQVAGVQPAASFESFKEGINMLLIAARVHNDARVKKVADNFCEVFTEMLRELEAVDAAAKKTK